jgi:hypothetical protein
MIKVTEIVLLIVVVSLCAALFLKIITGEQFLPPVIMILGYFFKEKADLAIAEAKAKLG